jgi:phosphatidylglycerophosphatase A
MGYDRPMSATAPATPRMTPLSAVAHAIATGLGSGYSPIAPGTAGSAVGLLLYWPLVGLPMVHRLVATALISCAGIVAATHVARRAGLHDPGVVVIDEVAGMWTSLLFLPFTPFTAVAGFFLFRIMDIVKPYPARALEALPDGWGIMADDLMAGIYANLLLRVALLIWPVTA